MSGHLHPTLHNLLIPLLLGHIKPQDLVLDPRQPAEKLTATMRTRTETNDEEVQFNAITASGLSLLVHEAEVPQAHFPQLMEVGMALAIVRRHEVEMTTSNPYPSSPTLLV